MTTGRLQRLVTGAFPSPAGRASARRVRTGMSTTQRLTKALTGEQLRRATRVSRSFGLRRTLFSERPLPVQAGIDPTKGVPSLDPACSNRQAGKRLWLGWCASESSAATRVEASGQPTGRHGTSELAAEPRLSQPKGAEGHRGVKTRRSVRTQVKLAWLKTASSHCAQGGAKPRRRNDEADGT